MKKNVARLKATTAFVHPSAEVAAGAQLAEGSQIWLNCQVREGVVIGRNTSVGKGSYIDVGVRIGENVKIQNHCSIYHGVTINSGVFVGPHVCFTNDKFPRAVNPDGRMKSTSDWTVSATLVDSGASLGAGSIIVCGVTIGKWAMVAAGAVVTKDVPDYGLVMGNPARLSGYVCSCGKRMKNVSLVLECVSENHLRQGK